MNIFEFATRNKLRFSFKGMISVEDLWDLSVRNLDSIYKTLKKQQKETDEESLLETKTQEDTIVDVQIEIIKHIVSIKQAEEKARLDEKKIKEENEKIMRIIERKNDAALEDMSVEELTELLKKSK